MTKQEFHDILKYPLRAKTLQCLEEFEQMVLACTPSVVEVNRHMTGQTHVIQVKATTSRLFEFIVNDLHLCLKPLDHQYTLKKPATSAAYAIKRPNKDIIYVETYLLEEEYD